jgi:hypothetical protein
MNRTRNQLKKERTKMTTQIKIKITDAPEELAKFTHASLSAADAKSLARHIVVLTDLGLDVVSANGARSTVPTSYRSAYKMRAPHWHYFSGKIVAVSAKLENRSRGASIPANFTVRGSVETPSGFRCTSRNDEFTILRVA